MNTTDFLHNVLASPFLNVSSDGTEAAIPYLWIPGKCPLVLVLGENASGKSVFRRIVEGSCKRSKIQCMTLSMEDRCDTGFGGLARAALYGNEDDQATSVNSLRMVRQGIKTCKKRDEAHVIFWDEPDTGLSEGSAAGAGRAIANFAQAPGQHTVAAFVVCHSRAMVEQMMLATPHYIHVGVLATEAPQTLQAWLTRPVIIRDIDEVFEASHARFEKVLKTMNGLKK